MLCAWTPGLVTCGPFIAIQLLVKFGLVHASLPGPRKEIMATPAGGADRQAANPNLQHWKCISSNHEQPSCLRQSVYVYVQRQSAKVAACPTSVTPHSFQGSPFFFEPDILVSAWPCSVPLPAQDLINTLFLYLPGLKLQEREDFAKTFLLLLGLFLRRSDCSE